MSKTEIIGHLDDVIASLGKIRVLLQDDGQLEPIPDTKPLPPAAVTPWGKPFFGTHRAPWAVPIDAGLRRHPDNGRLVKEFKAMCDGSINLNSRSWANTLHMVDDDTPRATVVSISSKNGSNMNEGETIPWHPSFGHGDDSDSYAMLMHRETGISYIVWKTRYDRSRNTIRCGTCNLITDTTDPEKGGPIDVRIKDNGFVYSRACGIHLPAMMITRSEMEALEINHALALGLPQPSRTKRVAPAVKNIGRTGTDEPDRLGTGYRIAFGISDDDVGNWAARFPGKMKDYNYAIGTAVRRYGFIVCDNGGNRSRKIGAVRMEHDESAKWDEIGFTHDDSIRALHSLLEPNIDKSWIVEEPVFPGGDAENAAVYQRITYVQDAT